MEFDLYAELVEFIRNSATLEAELILILVGALFAALLIIQFGPRLVFWVYERCTINAVQILIVKAIYSLDYLADEMSHAEKRAQVIAKLQELVTIRGIRFPKFIYGWIVDVLVSNIRKEQSTCSKESDLHKDDG